MRVGYLQVLAVMVMLVHLTQAGNYVRLQNATVPPGLDALTVCSQLHISSTTNGELVSYNVGGSDEIALNNYGIFRFWINGQYAYANETGLGLPDDRCHTVCYTWLSLNGRWAFYVDGQQVDTGSGLATGHVIRAGGAWILGQEQDSSYTGDLSCFNVWDRVLTPGEADLTRRKCGQGGNVFDWSSEAWTVHGDVALTDNQCDVVSVIDVQNGTDQRQEFGGFQQGTARYWRFMITRTHGGYRPWLTELNLYGLDKGNSLLLYNLCKCRYEEGPCPYGWYPAGYVCYRAFDELASWQTASARCKREGGRLATVKDADTHNFLVALKNSIDPDEEFWIGLSDLDLDETWVWADGTSIGQFTAWGGNQPNYHEGDQFCASYWLHNSMNMPDLWNDANCIRSKKFICERGYHIWYQDMLEEVKPTELVTSLTAGNRNIDVTIDGLKSRTEYIVTVRAVVGTTVGGAGQPGEAAGTEGRYGERVSLGRPRARREGRGSGSAWGGRGHGGKVAGAGQAGEAAGTEGRLGRPRARREGRGSGSGLGGRGHGGKVAGAGQAGEAAGVKVGGAGQAGEAAGTEGRKTIVLQVDLGEMKRVAGTIIQGSGRTWGAWVRSYKLKYSEDGSSWTTYGSEKVFRGNTNAGGRVTNLLDHPVDARYVRFVVQSWSYYIAMRVEILACKTGKANRSY
ncbi:NPTX2 [Branchiostoma lanceolatum]|uniref:NPTX2 protein n=1 Tax=Branchiostoma lanceolatum TaxID=7740 RepID=A0A8S4MMD9_BRALA|nr:NPTX2 [Branchiostoma lanceolatum]